MSVCGCVVVDVFVCALLLMFLVFRVCRVVLWCCRVCFVCACVFTFGLCVSFVSVSVLLRVCVPLCLRAAVPRVCVSLCMCA